MEQFSKTQKYNKKYYEENKEQITEYHKKYRDLNRDSINTYQTEYYHKNKEKITEKSRTSVTCCCGKELKYFSYSVHKSKSKFHKQYLDSLTI